MILEKKWPAQSTQCDSLNEDFELNRHQIQLTKVKSYHLQKLNMESYRQAASFTAMKQLISKTLTQLLLSVSYHGVLLNLSYVGSQV